MRIRFCDIEGLAVVEPQVFSDDRGYFFESFNKQKYSEFGLEVPIVQTNISQSVKDVVRGLHFQHPPFAQGKLIRVLKGAVLDVAVDIRSGSKTYGKSFTIELNEDNKLGLWIPPGFAHGFRTLENDTLFYYDCTGIYDRASEGSILWNDPELNIDWGIVKPILSEKDRNAPLFKDFKSKFK